MNKIVIIVVLVLVVGGGFLLFGKSKDNTMVGEENMSESTMPVNESTEESTVKEFTIESKGLSFTPSQIKVKAGDTVKITYKNTMGKHDFALDEFNVKTQLLDAGQEETVEFVADVAGRYEYYCSVAGHRASGMKGALIVE